jgi:hypothetical protein
MTMRSVLKLIKKQSYNDFLILLKSNNRNIINNFKKENLLYIENNLKFDRYLSDNEVIDYYKDYI